MRVNHGLKPPNGPHFPVAPGVVLEAHTFEILYSMITEYRMRHGIPLGNVLTDVNVYVCSKWPNACLEEPGDGPTHEMRKEGMSRRVATWAALMARGMPAGGYALVDDGTAKARADICRMCHYNRDWRSGCAPCNGSSDALLSTIRRLRRVGVDNGLLGCENGGHDNNTAVFMPDSAMKPSDEERPRLPPGCWKKNIGLPISTNLVDKSPVNPV